MRWLLVAFVSLLFLSSNASAMGGINPSCSAPLNGVSEAAPAIANGFNCLRIGDSFASIDSIDINNTGNIKYTWKAQTDPTHNVFPPAGLTFNHPGITLLDTNSIEFPGLFSADSPDSTGVMVGRYFPNGGYFEANMAANISGSDPSYRTLAWPAFVLTSYTIFIQNSCPPGTEIDFFEYFPNTSAGSVIPLMSINQFAASLGTCGASTSNANNQPSITPGSSAHDYGTLWLTAAQNGGTGLYARYYDGTHLTTQCGGTCDVTYTVGGTGGQAEGTKQVMALFPGPGTFSATFNRVQAWTR